MPRRALPLQHHSLFQTRWLQNISGIISVASISSAGAQPLCVRKKITMSWSLCPQVSWPVGMGIVNRQAIPATESIHRAHQTLCSVEHSQLCVSFQDMGSWFLHSSSGGLPLPEPWNNQAGCALVQPLCPPKLFWCGGDRNNPMKQHCTSFKEITNL